jgi:hypothetical protein
MITVTVDLTMVILVKRLLNQAVDPSLQDQWITTTVVAQEQKVLDLKVLEQKQQDHKDRVHQIVVMTVDHLQDQATRQVAATIVDQAAEAVHQDHLADHHQVDHLEVHQVAMVVADHVVVDN